jgi:hypothetical protein
MTEINEVAETKSRKKWFIGGGVVAAIAIAIGATAIPANTNASPDAAPSVTTTASATAAPSATATPVAVNASSCDADVAEAKAGKEARDAKDWAAMSAEERNESILDHADPEIAKQFALSCDELKDALVRSMNIYSDLSGTYNFKVARADGPADSSYIASQYQDYILGDYIPTLKAQLDSQAPFPTANRDGSVATVDGVKYFGALNNPANILDNWVTALNRASMKYVEIKGAEKGTGSTHGIQYTGVRDDYVRTTDGTILKATSTYSFTVVRSATDAKWLLAGTGCTTTGITKISVDEFEAISKQAKSSQQLRELSDAKN